MALLRILLIATLLVGVVLAQMGYATQLFWLGMGSVILIGCVAAVVQQRTGLDTSHFPMTAGYLWTLLSVVYGLGEAKNDQEKLIGAIALALWTSLVGWAFGSVLNRPNSNPMEKLTRQISGELKKLISEISGDLRSGGKELKAAIEEFSKALKGSTLQLTKASGDITQGAQALSKTMNGLTHLERINVEEIATGMEKLVAAIKAAGEGTSHATQIVAQAEKLMVEFDKLLQAITEERLRATKN